MFLVTINDLEEVEICEVILDDHPLLRDYADVLPNEILGMLLECDINFCIDLVLGVGSIS